LREKSVGKSWQREAGRRKNKEGSAITFPERRKREKPSLSCVGRATKKRGKRGGR